MGAFKHNKVVIFQIDLSSDPYLWSCILGNDRKNITVTQVQAPKMRFLQRVHRVTKVCTEVRLHPGQETSLAPPYLNLRYFGSKCTALKKNLRYCCDCPHPQLFGSWGIVPPHQVPGVTLHNKVRSCEICRALIVETTSN